MSETDGQGNSGKTWSRKKIAILIVGILFIFMLVVILGYVFVKMSSQDEFSNIMTTVPAILSNNTNCIVSADKHSILNVS